MDGTVEAILAIRQALAKEGVTGFLPTTMTAESGHIDTVLKAISEAAPHPEGAAILGTHLEGPFLAINKKGAQNSDFALNPDYKLIRHWQNIAKGHVRMVTLAPELPGALDLIPLLHQMDIIACVGHTNATYEETVAAIVAGLRRATHLFNAMRGLHHREPGAAGALLLSDSHHD